MEALIVANEQDCVKGLVSIIMPNYNGECFIGAAIESVLRQTYINWELIIIDDASTDSSLNIIEQYLNRDGRIRLESCAINSGVAVSRNKGIALSRGEYIAFIDSDDIWLPEKLELQLQYIENEQAAVCFTSYCMIDEQGRIFKHRIINKAVTFDSLLRENIIIFSTVLLRHGVLQGTLFDTESFHEDFVFSLELLQKGAVYKGLPLELVQYRVQKNGKSFNKFVAAKHRWLIYRNKLHFSIGKTISYFVIYAINGIRKYL